jgi:hypothetical protein
MGSSRIQGSRHLGNVDPALLRMPVSRFYLEPVCSTFIDLYRFPFFGDMKNRISPARTGSHLDKGVKHDDLMIFCHHMAVKNETDQGQTKTAM